MAIGGPLDARHGTARLRPWPSRPRHSRSPRSSPNDRRPPPPSAHSPCRLASFRALGAGSAPSSTRRRAAGRGTNTHRSNGMGIPAVAPADGAPWRECAGQRPPPPANPSRAGGRPASCKGGRHRRSKAGRLPFTAAPTPECARSVNGTIFHDANIRARIHGRRRCTETDDEPGKPRRMPLARNTYQPSRAWLERDMRVDATFDEAVDALCQPVRIGCVDRPKR